jgi:hypothetical protein
MHSNLYLTQLQIQAQQQRIGDLTPAAGRPRRRHLWRSVAARVLPLQARWSARRAGAPVPSGLQVATPANHLAC